MLDIEEIHKALQDRVVTAVANHTGLHRNTVSAIKGGDIANVSKKTQRLLSDYLCLRYER